MTDTRPSATPVGKLHQLFLDNGFDIQRGRPRAGNPLTLLNVAALAGLDDAKLRRALGLIPPRPGGNRFIRLDRSEITALVNACHQAGAAGITYEAFEQAHLTDLGHSPAFDVKLGASTTDALAGVLSGKPDDEQLAFVIEFVRLTLEGRETPDRINTAVKLIQSVLGPTEQAAVVQQLMGTIAQAWAAWGARGPNAQSSGEDHVD